MRYEVVWTLPNGQSERATFADEGDARIEASHRANKFAMAHGQCDITITDETGQLLAMQTNSYYA